MEKMKKNSNKKSNKSNKKKSNLSTIILVLIIVVGMVIMLYPSVSDWWNRKHMSQAIESYVEQVENLDDDKKIKFIEEATEYNNSLSTGVHFFSEERNPEEYEKYLQTLDITGTGIMGYIQIPSVNINLPIYHGTSDAVLQVAVGHIAGSSLPVGGRGTHAILSGHRGLPSAKLFTDLDQLIIGDVFMVNVLNETFTYQVDQIRTVLPEEVSDLAIVDGKDYVTLVTCTPYGVNSHRMLVRAHRIDNLPDEVREILISSDAVKVPAVFVMLAVAFILIIFALIVSMVGTSIRKKKKSGHEILKALHTDNSRGEDRGNDK